MQKPVEDGCAEELPVVNAGEDFPEGGMPGTEDPAGTTFAQETPAAGGAVTDEAVAIDAPTGPITEPTADKATEAADEAVRLADAVTEATALQAVCGGCRPCPNRVGRGPGGGDGVIAPATRLPMPAGGVGDDTLVVPTPLAEDTGRPHAPPLLTATAAEEPGALPALTGALLLPGPAAIFASAAAVATAAVLPVVLELKGMTPAVALLQVTA